MTNIDIFLVCAILALVLMEWLHEYKKEGASEATSKIVFGALVFGFF